MPFIQDQNNTREDYIIIRKTTPVLSFVHNKATRGLLLLILFAIIVPALIYYLVIHLHVTVDANDHTCAVKNTYRVPCGRTESVTFEYCTQIHCCHDNTTNLCFHYLPSKYYYFRDGTDGYHQTSLKKTPFGNQSLPEISISLNEIDENSIEIILHETSAIVETNTVANKNYNCVISESPLFVEVYRKDTDVLLLTTANGPTIASELYWEWSFQLTESYLFGLGELLIDLDEKSTLTRVIYGNSEDHNTLPIFMANRNGSFHGLIVRHVGPLEVTVLPSKVVTLKILVGGQISLELSVGPTPRDVIRQQKRQHIVDVPFWTLGVHVCREGEAVELDEIIRDYNDNSQFDFQYESDCLHENLAIGLYNKSESDNTLQTVFDDLKSKTDRFMFSLPPQIPVQYEAFIQEAPDVFYKNHSDSYQGKYLNIDVLYPHFGHEYITDFISLLLEKLKLSMGDANFEPNVILSQNWPRDDSYKMEKPDNFPYLSKALLEAMSSTLPWNMTSENQTHIIHHNDYGALQVQEILTQLEQQPNDVFLMTASHTLNILRPLIIQNVDISWTNFKTTITRSLYNSIFAHPLTSVPVCGSTNTFKETVHDSLCMRWYLMASTSPIFRISSDLPRRDPTSFLSQTLANVAKFAIDLRHKLQYYYYTVLKDNEPLMRPMFYDFPDDNETFPLNEQYMVGSGLLVAQPTLPDKASIQIYLPVSVEVWYEFWGGQALGLDSRQNGWITFNVAESDWIGFIAHGTIIPLVEAIQSPSVFSVELKVALECSNATVCTSAKGNLSIGEDNFVFDATEFELSIERQRQDSNDGKEFKLQRVLMYQYGKSIVTHSLEINLFDIVDSQIISLNSTSSSDSIGISVM